MTKRQLEDAIEWAPDDRSAKRLAEMLFEGEYEPDPVYVPKEYPKPPVLAEREQDEQRLKLLELRMEKIKWMSCIKDCADEIWVELEIKELKEKLSKGDCQ